jgi:hypothetical protein
MGARLVAAVHLWHPSTREAIVLQPGEEPEPGMAALITNPEAWEDGILPEPPQLDEHQPSRVPLSEPVTGLLTEPVAAVTTATPEPQPATAPGPKARTRKAATE